MKRAILQPDLKRFAPYSDVGLEIGTEVPRSASKSLGSYGVTIVERTTYWQNQESRLLGELGYYQLMPMEYRAVIGHGASLAMGQVLRLKVLGHEREAHAIVDDFLPTLKSFVFDPANAPNPEDSWTVHGHFAHLAEVLSVSYWLRHFVFDDEAAELAWRLQSELAALEKPEGPGLLHLMLCALEAKRPDAADRAYQAWEKRALSERPNNYRFVSNVRHLLFTCIHSSRHQTETEVPTNGLQRFRNRANNWEKGIQPVPYVGIVELARVLNCGYSLIGQPIHREELLRQLW